MSDLQIEIVPSTEGTLIRLTGAADFASMDRLQASLLGISVQRPTLVVFDLAEFAYAASLFMGILVSFAAASSATAARSGLRLCSRRRGGVPDREAP